MRIDYTCSPLKVVVCFMQILTGEFVILKKRPKHPLYPGLLGFPAGRARINELPLHAILREIREETGVSLAGHAIEHWTEGGGYYRHQVPTDFKELCFFTDFYFVRQRFLPEKRAIRIDPREHQEAIFLREDEILSLDSKLLVEDVIADFSKFIRWRNQVKKSRPSLL